MSEYSLTFEVMDVPAHSRTRRFLILSLSLTLLAALAVPALADGAPAAASGAAVSGVVSDAEGSPVSGATVEVMRQDLGQIAVTTTGSDGSYTLNLGGAPGLDFRLRVWAKGFGTAEQTWVPMVDGSRVDFTVTVLTAALAGRVLDPNASPVAGAQVQVYRKGAGLAASAVSGTDGSYRIAGLQAGASYEVAVVLAGYSAFQQVLPALSGGATLRLDPVVSQTTAQLSGQVVDAQSGTGIAGARLEVLRQGRGLVVEGKTDAAGNFTYSVPGTAAVEYQVRVLADGYAAYASSFFALPGGSVKDMAGADQVLLSPALGSVAGFVFDQSGSARANVPVHLDKLGIGTIATAVTDSTGWYAITGVPAASDQSYRIRALPQGSDTATATDSAWFSLAGGTQYEADINLPLLSPTTGPNGTISGRVVDDSGRPVAGVTVQANRALSPAGNNNSAVTDANGHYRIDLPASRPNTYTAPPGYVLSVNASGYFPNDQPVLITPVVATTTSPYSTPPAPPPAALVDVYPYKVTTANFTLHASSGRISGRALDPQGRPVAGATATLLREGKGSVATVTTDAAGRYSFSGFPVVGRPSYLVEIHAGGYLPSVLTRDGTGSWLADTSGGLGLIQDVRLQPDNASVAGAVVNADGRAVGRATVTATDLVSGKTYTATTDASGLYAISGLPAAGQSYAISVTADHSLASALLKSGDLAAVLAPAPGDRLTADLLLLPDNASLSGTVFDSDGSPLPGARVELWQEGVGSVAQVASESAGRYSFSGLVPGARYAVRAAKDGYRASSLKYGLQYVPGLVSVEGGDRITWNLVLYR